MSSTRVREGDVPVGKARLYYREVGDGRPIVILHGGPDFDHAYLLPDMDRLAFGYRLLYYDQRGRGRSAENTRPGDVTIETEVEDLDALRTHFGLESVALLGHSWGGLLALEYAVRHPGRVSHLILMNTAPASHDDFRLLRQALSRQRTEEEIEAMQALSSSDAYARGDLETDAKYYRIHFRPTVRPGDLESLVRRLRSNSTEEGILKARAIESRLYEHTWLSEGYDLTPRLARLAIPTLLLHGDRDFIPREISEHIAHAIPGSHLVSFQDCGHFSYVECPNEVRNAIEAFFGDRGAGR